MKSKLIKILTLCMVVCLSICAFAACSGAKGEDENSINYSEGLDFVLNEEQSGYILTGIGVCNDRKVVIPNEYSGKPIVAIGEKVFCQDGFITEIVIPDSVTSIGYEAFYGCNALRKITLPFVGATKEGTNNTHFGYIFGASSFNYNYDYVPTSLKTVTITGGTSIDVCAFLACSSLTSIVIPDSVTSIGLDAFRSCSSLTSIELPNSVTSIGEYAFYYCRSLKNIEIPNSVKFIGEYAFRDCSNLASIVIPKSVTSIGYDAFYGCYKLTIYCEAGVKPDGWDSRWNSANLPVVWGYKG